MDPAKDGANWYGYCGGDPVNRIDPSGMLFKELGSFAGGVIGGGIGFATGGVEGAKEGWNKGSEVGGNIGQKVDDFLGIGGNGSNGAKSGGGSGGGGGGSWGPSGGEPETTTESTTRKSTEGTTGTTKQKESEETTKPTDTRKIKDPITAKRIETLHPDIRIDVTNFILDVQDAGVVLRITDAYRSIDEQNELYAQGRTKPSNIVTNAKGGQSYHNYGLAIDVVEYNMETGEVNYNSPNQAKYVEIAKAHGFEWGGDWEKFPDYPHFQMSFGFTEKELLAKYNSGETTNGYVNVK